jgi:hypothetical protein
MNPVITFLQHAWQFHPILTVVLGVVFFPEIEVVFLVLALLFALVS